jgi:Spy/CpxP family protein refolding chaperone
MKPWIKRTLFGLFGASLLAGGLSACGHRHHGADAWQASAEETAKWRERALDRAGKELQLDDAQKQRLGVVFDSLREQRTALIGSTLNPRAEVGTLIKGDKFDAARAQALVEEKTGAIRGKSPEVIAAFAGFYDTLKPEQQQKLRDLLAKRHGGWRG